MDTRALAIICLVCLTFAVAVGVVRSILSLLRMALLAVAIVAGLALLLLWFTPHVAHAQGAPPAQSQGQEGDGGLLEAINRMVAQMGDAMTSGVLTAATRYTEETDNGGPGALILRGLGWAARGFTGALFGDTPAAEALTKLAPSLLWDNPVVRSLWDRLSLLTGAVVGAIVTAWGLWILVNFGGNSFKEVFVLQLPRLALCVALGTGSYQLTQWAGETANAFSSYVRTGSGSIASLAPPVPPASPDGETSTARRARLQAETDRAPADLVNAFGAVSLGISRLLFSHGVFALLQVTSSLAALAWAFPPWNRYYRVWFRLLQAICVGQGLQAICLELATAQLTSLTSGEGHALYRGLLGASWLILASVAPGLAGMGGMAAGAAVTRATRVPGPVGQAARVVSVVTRGAGAASSSSGSNGTHTKVK